MISLKDTISAAKLKAGSKKSRSKIRRSLKTIFGQLQWKIIAKKRKRM